MSSRVAVVGAAGRQARKMLEVLASAMDMSTVLAIDRRWPDEARVAVEALGAHTIELDLIADREGVLERCEGVTLLANLAGPFYRLGTSILDVALECGADYLDICDDSDATELLMAKDAEVRAAGRVALIGMGSSPGTTNVLVRAALDALAEPAKAAVDIAWVVDRADMTPAAVGHFLHCFQTAIPGRNSTPAWEELAPEEVTFPDPVGTQMVITLGHPEPVTLVRYADVARATNKGGVVPGDYLHVCYALSRIHGGDRVVEEIQRLYGDYDRIASLGHERSGSGMRVDVHIDGTGYRFASGSTMSMEVSTGVPAATGVLLMLSDSGLAPGVQAPECLRPGAFFSKLREVSSGGGGLHLLELRDGEEGERVRIRDLLAHEGASERHD